MAYKIDKNIPAPKAGRGQASRKYPFDDMGVGDSVCIDAPANLVQVSAYNYASRSGKKFVTRKVDGGVRVWRVA